MNCAIDFSKAPNKDTTDEPQTKAQLLKGTRIENN